MSNIPPTADADNSDGCDSVLRDADRMAFKDPPTKLFIFPPEIFATASADRAVLEVRRIRIS